MGGAEEGRVATLDLKSHALSHADCETLEEILKRVQYRAINLSSCGLDDISATAIFDMVEYYEATAELDIGDNREIKNRGWASCVNMVKRSQELRVLVAQGTPISESNAMNLGKALGAGSALHTLKLEHCGMTGRPIASLCTALKKSTVLKELWLADNDLNSFDAYNIAMLLKANLHIQFLHVSNNNIKDEGISYLSDAIIEQTRLIKEPFAERSARMDYSELSASLNYLNNNKCLSPSFKKSDKPPPPFDEVQKAAAAAEKPKIHLLGRSNRVNNNDFVDEEDDEVVKAPEKVSPEKEPLEKIEEIVSPEPPPQLPKIEMNANEESTATTETNSSPLNSKSLKEELELLQPIDIPTTVKAEEPVAAAVAKSLDTDSSSLHLIPPMVGRSFSSESLNSLTSIDSNDSKSSIRITEAKFAKNGTLERQNAAAAKLEESSGAASSGIQVLILWNNKLSKNASKSIGDMIAQTATLEVLNVGRNNLGNDFVASIKTSLKVNTSLHTFGLQGTHLSCPGR